MGRRGRRRRAAALGLVGVGAVLIAIAGCAGVPVTPLCDRATPSAVPVRVAAASLPLIDPSVKIPEYRRAVFGEQAWVDVDGNGCRQRDDVLARDLVDVVRSSNGCTVLRGVLPHDPYTGHRIVFEHDRVAEPGNPGSQGIEIDHVVSLAAAFRGGAWAWTAQCRLEFANTVGDELLAVDGPTNIAKSDAGPARWLPSPESGFRCAYAARYTRILFTWGLAVDERDRAALVQVLDECPAS